MQFAQIGTTRQTGIGKNTKAIFDSLPTGDPNAVIEVGPLRDAIDAWDASAALPYPENISVDNFKALDIGGVSTSVYISPDASEDTKTLVVFHGGGFCCELANIHRAFSANIAATIPCHIVLVHYSLAPDTKAPTPIKEAVKCLEAIISSPREYGISSKVSVLGYSSGGNVALSAVMRLLHNRTTAPFVSNIQHLILMSPWLDISMNASKQGPYTDLQNLDQMCSEVALQQMASWYVPESTSAVSPEISPIYFEWDQFRGLPSVTLINGMCERLLNDGAALVPLLEQAGVPLQWVLLEGQTHNHTAHAELANDGVSTVDIVATVLSGGSVADLTASDDLEIVVIDKNYQQPAKNSSLRSAL
jgi:acetyl esterase/lipase